MKDFPKRYNAIERDSEVQLLWQNEKVYKWDQNRPREETFVIDTPPPTVSGSLHMGHVFSYTQADFVARYKRQKGITVFYPMGFDDNGLPTERLVEKTKKVRAVDLGREDFIKVCEDVSEEARIEFRKLFESIALSIDWEQEYHTISAESRTISQMSFLDLVDKSKVYRKLQPMLWDPVDQTAIAQAEIEDHEKPSKENYIPFGIVDNEGNKLQDVTIMTTRPELLPACVALMCHPDDISKYKNCKATTPLFNVEVPIVADEKVDKEKGTGLVMCCTFGDETDIEWWKTHNLDLRIILNKYGKIDYSLFDNLDGLNAFKEKYPDINGKKTGVFRAEILNLLEQQSLLLKQVEITHSVKCAERSGAELEFIPTNQWFVKVLDIKDELKTKANECNWKPEFMKARVEQWIDGLSWDWCISRQRYFGVPFPVWYSKRAGEEGKILYADKSQLPVNPLVDLPKGYTKEEVTPEVDVMDTWATSSVSPQLSSKAINKDFAIDLERHKKLFPADLRPQAHEIIRTWAFYTIVKAYLHEETIPWKNLMISGWCLAADKTKMSKSKGNVVTPTALVQEKSADVVRYWASTSRLGADTAYSEEVLKIGKKFTNKLWNSCKFAAYHINKLEAAPKSCKALISEGLIYEPLDLWIISRLGETIAKAEAEFEEFEYCEARVILEDFFWNDLCDNYLEMIKVRVYGEESEEKPQYSAIYTLYYIIKEMIRTFAPIVPHVTEDLWQIMYTGKFGEQGSVHKLGNWPIASDYPTCEEHNKVGKLAIKFLDEIRKIKADAEVSIKHPILEIKTSGAEALKSAEFDLASVTSAKKITFTDGEFNVEAKLEELAQSSN